MKEEKREMTICQCLEVLDTMIENSQDSVVQDCFNAIEERAKRMTEVLQERKEKIEVFEQMLDTCCQLLAYGYDDSEDYQKTTWDENDWRKYLEYNCAKEEFETIKDKGKRKLMERE